MKNYAKNLPTLAVVVPVYNEAGILQTCLESLLKQAEDVHQIILVDNNSTDDSLEIAKNYAAKNKIFKVVQETRQGIIPARNLGLMTANADLVGRIDADTFILPGWARSIREYFDEHSEVAAVSGPTYYYDLPFYKLTAKLTGLVISGFNQKTSGSGSLYGPNMALRTATAKKMAENDCGRRHINEDLDLTIHLHESGEQIEFCPEMRAEISGRRFLTGPISYLHYCLQWPRTYRVHRKYWPACTAYGATFFICLAQALLVLPLRTYDPAKHRFSFKHLLDFKNGLVLP